MVRSVGIAAVVVGLAWTGLCCAQPSSPGAAAPRERYITVREDGRTPQRCQLYRAWRQPNGAPVFLVRAADTGEIMTIVGAAPASTGEQGQRTMSTRIFRWGPDNKPPAGAPLPPTASAATARATPIAPPVRSPAPPTQPLRNPSVTQPRPSTVASQMSPAVRPAPNLQKPATPTVQRTPAPNLDMPSKPAPTTVKRTPATNSWATTAQRNPAPNPRTTTTPAPASTAFAGQSKPTAASVAATPAVQSKATPTPARTVSTAPLIQPYPPATVANPSKPTRVVTAQPIPSGKSVPNVAPSTSRPAIPSRPARLPEVVNCTPSTSPQPRLVPLAEGTIIHQGPCNCGGQPKCGPCCASCDVCCPSCCVCSRPPRCRQSWLSRLFHSKPACCPTCQPAPTVVATKPTTPAVQPVKPAPAVAKVATEPAQPSDWRESWGKIEPWKGAPPADAAKAASAPPKRVVQTPAPRPTPKRVTYVPVQIEPPKQPDPLKDPAWFGDTALQKKLSNSKIPKDKAAFASSYHVLGQKIPASNPPAPSAPPTRIAAAPAPAPAQPIKQPQPAPLPPVNQPQPPAPPVREMASLPPPQAAKGTVEIPANEANAFWAPETTAKKEGQQADSAFNAFDRENNDPPPSPDVVAMAAGPQRPMSMPMAAPAMGPMPMPMPPRPPMPPPMPDSGVPSGMANAFTLAGTRRPIPADFGGTPQEPNGFGNAVPFMDLQGGPPRPYAVPRQGMMMPYPGMQRPMMVNPLMSVPPTQVAYARPAATPMGPMDGASPLLAALKGSLYPSEREQAAEQLSEQNWRTQPQIVEGLMKGARDDPAATVRAACVRALAHMKANTVGVTSLVQLLKNDRDARVRHEAEEALTSLGVAPAARQDSGVQQASHR